MTAASDNSGFASTRWTLIERTRGDSPEARAALSELCAAYYAPVVAFLHRSGREEDAAREQAHGFFAHLLERDALGGAERERGRFRSYLLGALKHFLAREHERAQRRKRGGGSVAVPLDAGTDTSPGLILAEAHALPPDAFFRPPVGARRARPRPRRAGAGVHRCGQGGSRHDHAVSGASGWVDRD